MGAEKSIYLFKNKIYQQEGKGRKKADIWISLQI